MPTEHVISLPAPRSTRNHRLILSRLPPWLSGASLAQRQGFARAVKRSQNSTAALGRHMQGFKSVSDFAAPLLDQALQAHYGPGLDVKQDQLRHVHILAAATAGSPRQESVLTQSLLQAALQNFESGETGYFGFDRGSAILRQSSKVLKKPITAPDFAALCRQLDLGGQYRKHIEGFLLSAKPGQPAPYRVLFEQQQRDELALQAEIALIQGHLDAAAYQMLQSLVDPSGTPRWNNRRVTCNYLTLLDFPSPSGYRGALLKGVLLIERDDPAGADGPPCVLYLAGDPRQAVKQYASRQAAHDALRERLRGKAYQAVFTRYLHVRAQPAFFQALAEQLTPIDRTSGLRKPAANADLHLRLSTLGSSPFSEFCDLQTVKRLDDARVTAVPTDDENQKTRLARLKSLLSWTTNLLFLVPGLGEAMLAVAAGQLIVQVYNGIEQWRHDEKEQAVLGFLGVVLNLELFAVGAAMQAGFDGSSFIEGLHPIQPSPTEAALWKPDLAAYAHDLPDSVTAAPDATGLLHHEGKTYLHLDGRNYQLRPGNGANRFHLLHPTHPDSYAPLLLHNGKGAWQFEFEQPWQWQRSRLFARLGPDAASLDPAAVDQVMQVSGIDDSLLRRMHMDQEVAPALLEDCIIRFKLDRDLGNLIRRLRDGGAASHSLDELHMELQLLTSEPVWPRAKVLRLLDRGSVRIQEYPAGQPPQVRRIDLHWPGLDANQLLGKVLANLDEGEIRSLLNEPFGEGPFSLETRTGNLRRKLAPQAISRRRALFDSHYRYRSQSARPAAVMIQRDFPGLSAPIAEELARNANPLELKQLLATRRIPLRLAEEARHYLRKQRLARALEGLYLKSAGQADTGRLILRLLEKLPGWSRQVRLEIQDRYLGGPLLDSIGPESASIRKILVRNGEHYETYDALGQELHGPDDLYASVLHALPDAERKALGFPSTHQASGLKQHLLQHPLPSRAALEKLLGLPPIRPGYKLPMRLADGRIGYPLSGHGTGTGVQRSRSAAFTELAERLYPDHSWAETEAFLGLRGLNEGAAVLQLEQQEAIYNTLCAELDAWVAASSSSAEHQLSRTQIATGLKRCWSRASSSSSTLGGYQFNLFDTLDMAPLPSLPTDFGHVTELTLFHGASSVATNIDHFLERFPGLVRLTVRGGILKELPAALSTMPRLTSLDLSNNQMVLSEQAAAQLSRLTRLKRLDLSRNPLLGRTPDLAPMSGLIFIYLNNCELNAWPRGFEQLPELQLLDLRSNNLTHVPQALLDSSERGQRLAQTLNLFNNPIDNLDDVALYREETGLDLNLELEQSSDSESEGSPSNPESVHSPELARDPVPRDELPWLQGLEPGAELEDFRNDWMLLASEEPIEHSEEFFRVLHDLDGSADYLDPTVRPTLLDKVRRMVQAAVKDTELREKLFLKANSPEADACTDGITVAFSDMGLDVLIHEAYAEPEWQQIEAKLLQLARGKSRLDRVNQLAKAEIDRRAGNPDQAEIYLAYRIGLAERLGLPWQASNMQYPGVANITSAHLDAAYEAILDLERQPRDLVRETLRQPFWESYLNDQHLQELTEKRALRDRKGSALEELKSAQERWFNHASLTEDERAALQVTLRACATLLGQPPQQVFARAMTDAEYQALYQVIASEYTDELERLTEEALFEHGMAST